MVKRKKKERQLLTFSYLDVFFILLAGCIISLGIYLFAENTGAVPVKEYRVEASAHYRGELMETVPQGGDALYDGSGNQIGELLAVKKEQVGAGAEVLLTFVLQGDAPEIGDTFTVETASALVEAKILNVTESERREAE